MARRNLYKVPRVTKRQLREYLEANPTKSHKCGDPQMCVVADYYKDTALRAGETVRVSSTSTSIADRYGNQVAFKKHPLWVVLVIKAFDMLRTKSGRVQSRTVLKKLDSLLSV
jgi:hypothetical protein